MNFIPLARPDLQDQDIAAAVEVLKSGMLVQGPKVEALEKKVQGLIQSNYVSAVSNGTATLHLALKVLNIGPGDEVIVPAFSYVATANVVELVGATCRFVDIDPLTFNIDTSKIEAAISPKTKAIIPVHEFGLMCKMEEVMKIAAEHKLWVIEDAACALGASAHGKSAGTFGEFGSFSLHPRKAISSGEGGLLCSNAESLDQQVKILRNHGISTASGKMEFVEAGFNYRMTDFQAALVSSQLERLKDIIAKKQTLADQYLASITNPGITLPFVPEGFNHTWQTFHVVINGGIDRDSVIEHLKSKNIGSNYGAQCIPAQQYYQRKYQLNCENNFPMAMNAYQNGLALPIYERLTMENISYISEVINTLK